MNMDQKNNLEAPNISLPSPVLETLNPSQLQDDNKETTPLKESKLPNSKLSDTFTNPLGVGSLTVPGVSDDDDSDNSTASFNLGTPSVAADDDLIEKEWVEKAKQIVYQNREDPYNQNKQISAVKADYMKKRFNKDIKISG